MEGAGGGEARKGGQVGDLHPAAVGAFAASGGRASRSKKGTACGESDFIAAVRRLDPLADTPTVPPLDPYLLSLAWRLLRWRSADRISAAEALRLPAFASEVPAQRLTTEVQALAVSRALEPPRGCERGGGGGGGVTGRRGGASTAAISAKGAAEWKKEASSRIGSKERAKYALMTRHVHAVTA